MWNLSIALCTGIRGMQCIIPYERSRQYLICLDIIYQCNVIIVFANRQSKQLNFSICRVIRSGLLPVLKLNCRPLRIRTYNSWCLLESPWSPVSSVDIWLRGWLLIQVFHCLSSYQTWHSDWLSLNEYSPFLIRFYGHPHYGYGYVYTQLGNTDNTCTHMHTRTWTHTHTRVWLLHG